MADYGALAENSRRNERIERGSVTVTGSATVGLAPSGNTVNLGAVTVPAGGPTMRQMTHFQLTIDDAGAVLSGIVAASTAVVTGSLNAAGTVLTIHCNSTTSSSNPTLIASTNATVVRYQIWGNLSAGAGF